MKIKTYFSYLILLFTLVVYFQNCARVNFSSEDSKIAAQSEASVLPPDEGGEGPLPSEEGGEEGAEPVSADELQAVYYKGNCDQVTEQFQYMTDTYCPKIYNVSFNLKACLTADIPERGQQPVGCENPATFAFLKDREGWSYDAEHRIWTGTKITLKNHVSYPALNGTYHNYFVDPDKGSKVYHFSRKVLMPPLTVSGQTNISAGQYVQLTIEKVSDGMEYGPNGLYVCMKAPGESSEKCKSKTEFALAATLGSGGYSFNKDNLRFNYAEEFTGSGTYKFFYRRGNGDQASQASISVNIEGGCALRFLDGSTGTDFSPSLLGAKCTEEGKVVADRYKCFCF